MFDLIILIEHGGVEGGLDTLHKQAKLSIDYNNCILICTVFSLKKIEGFYHKSLSILYACHFLLRIQGDNSLKSNNIIKNKILL